ncbi:MAG: hypothetical protein JSS66_06205 [Armatimonadetes bacterium]|nr:hypothetical protein [Armatimonadota bacterium]
MAFVHPLYVQEASEFTFAGLSFFASEVFAAGGRQVRKEGLSFDGLSIGKHFDHAVLVMAVPVAVTLDEAWAKVDQAVREMTYYVQEPDHSWWFCTAVPVQDFIWFSFVHRTLMSDAEIDKRLDCDGQI